MHPETKLSLKFLFPMISIKKTYFAISQRGFSGTIKLPKSASLNFMSFSPSFIIYFGS